MSPSSRSGVQGVLVLWGLHVCSGNRPYYRGTHTQPDEFISTEQGPAALLEVRDAHVSTGDPAISNNPAVIGAPDRADGVASSSVTGNFKPSRLRNGTTDTRADGAPSTPIDGESLLSSDVRALLAPRDESSRWEWYKRQTKGKDAVDREIEMQKIQDARNAAAKGERTGDWVDLTTNLDTIVTKTHQLEINIHEHEYNLAAATQRLNESQIQLLNLTHTIELQTKEKTDLEQKVEHEEKQIAEMRRISEKLHIVVDPSHVSPPVPTSNNGMPPVTDPNATGAVDSDGARDPNEVARAKAEVATDTAIATATKKMEMDMEARQKAQREKDEQAARAMEQANRARIQAELERHSAEQANKVKAETATQQSDPNASKASQQI